ncbi:nitrous oxide reductase family maturation protein NosD [Echinicola marina]|uniref:Carbohydrate-binding/sugar hydrolysis domain-containing protein n=2 Tax=Cyclobacteriaceae TaxID=563798 RepID=A0ABQ1VD57_9BACT|nr:nitrous oxide reductase family maturation protein NosD [Echinicola marina]GGF50464.1 hypothetical protein GCM10011339_43800 [Echinicola rosea]
MMVLALFLAYEVEATVWHIRPGDGSRPIKEALENSQAHDTLFVHSGIYEEYGLQVTKPLSIIGQGNAVIDGGFKGEIIKVFSNNVQIKGLVFKNVGEDFLEDRAAIRLVEVSQVVIEGNELINTFFGIYLQNAQECKIRNNKISGMADQEAYAGNAIHLWKCRKIAIENNIVSGHRDGIYLEFVDQSRIYGNISEDNLRYGLHFMFSNYDTYENNIFQRNGAGVAVMFSKHIRMVSNVFRNNWGGASYGILLKEISDGLIHRNDFQHNTVGVYAEGANRLNIRFNEFSHNGKAMDIKGNCVDNNIHQNNFIGNTFEVLTNSKSSLNHFEGNYWSQYHGYDLDKDGIGDVPYRPVNLFAIITHRIPSASMLLHSLIVKSLELAEKLFPQIIPEQLQDEKPMMKPISYD